MVIYFTYSRTKILRAIYLSIFKDSRLCTTLMRILTLVMAIALSCGELFAQCSQLSITTQQQVLCAPSKVQFVLNNLPPSSSVKWDFGNGQINGSDTIYEFFLDPVCLSPTATVYLPGAKSCVVKAFDTVHVVGKPKPSFEVSRKKLCDGPNEFSYDDKDLCELEFTYYVVAFNSNLESRSNTDNSTPQYTDLEQDISVIRATVADDEYVNVKWPKNCEPSFRKYSLRITDLKDGTVIDDFQLEDTSYNHHEAMVNESNYLYEISAIDHCDITYSDARPGSSILLTATYINGTSLLKWTPYQQWANGVDEYVIEILVNGSYREIARVSGDVTRYDDSEFHEDVTGAYIYRIKALKGELSNVHSISNTVRVVGPSSVWTPNAFTPNKDNLNETFKPSMQFIQQITDGGKYIYEMNIFNRWGEKLFSTTDQTQGWNGHYMGKKAPIGSYLYTVRVFGLDKELYNLSGQVLILE